MAKSSITKPQFFLGLAAALGVGTLLGIKLTSKAVGYGLDKGYIKPTPAGLQQAGVAPEVIQTLQQHGAI